MRDWPHGAGHGHGHGHWDGTGPGEHLGAVWPLLGLLVLAVVAAAVLAAFVASRRGIDVRAWPAALLQAVRSAGAGTPPAPAGVPARPGIDLAALAAYPPVVRERFAGLAAVVEELQAHVDASRQGAEALHQHRLQALRQAVQELAETLGGLPLDVAQAPPRHGGPSPLEAAAGTVELLEAEARRLRDDVYAVAVSRLQQQHRFAVGKYGQPGSALDL